MAAAQRAPTTDTGFENDAWILSIVITQVRELQTAVDLHRADRLEWSREKGTMLLRMDSLVSHRV